MTVRLRCYVMRYRIVDNEGAYQNGVMCAIHESEQAAVELLHDHFTANARSVVSVSVGTMSLVESAYLVRQTP